MSVLPFAAASSRTIDRQRADAAGIGSRVEGARLRQRMLLANNFIREHAAIDGPDYRIGRKARAFKSR